MDGNLNLKSDRQLYYDSPPSPWVDATKAYNEVKKGNATGNNCALIIRGHLQKKFYNLGCFVQKHCGKVAFIGVLIMCLCCIGLKSPHLETDLEKLWVEDSGRLRDELKHYRKTVEKAKSVHVQSIIQESKRNILNRKSISLLSEALVFATNGSIRVNGRNWEFKDICHRMHFPPIDSNFEMDMRLEMMTPCVFVSPLDCFWEGSKLLDHFSTFDALSESDWLKKLTNPGLRRSVVSLRNSSGSTSPNAEDDSYYDEESDQGQLNNRWSYQRLRPIAIIEKLSETPLFHHLRGLLQFLAQYLIKGGMADGYVSKDRPCLNPKDPGCPKIAPNYAESKEPNIGEILAGGCHGLSKTFMKWPEELLVGGSKKNSQGNIIEAHAFQAVIQIMSGERLHYNFKSRMPKNDPSWELDVAKSIITSWLNRIEQRILEFQKRTASVKSAYDKFYPYTPSEMGNKKAMAQINAAASGNPVYMAAGFCVLLVYVGVCLLNWRDLVNSQAFVGLTGVFLLALSSAAGLGISSVLNITFNVASTQVLPFIVLGLGVDYIFIISYTLANVKQFMPLEKISSKEFKTITGECLKRIGPNLVLTNICIISGFGLAAATMPIPALRALSLQGVILTTLTLLNVTLVFPAFISLDLYRRKSSRVDVFCCVNSSPITIRLFDGGQMAEGDGGEEGGAAESGHPLCLTVNPLPPSEDDQPPPYSTYEPHYPTGSSSSASCNNLPASSSSADCEKLLAPHSTHSLGGRTSRHQPRPTSASAVNLTSVAGGAGEMSHSSASSLHNESMSSSTSVSGEDGDECRSSRSGTSVGDGVSSVGVALSGCSPVNPDYQCCSITILTVLKSCFEPLIKRKLYKILVMLVFLASFVLSLWGAMFIKSGLRLTDIFPKTTVQYQFFEAQHKYFNIYNCYVVTKDLDYVHRQAELMRFHKRISSVPNVLTDKNGLVPNFWLNSFTKWLKDLQEAFDKAKARGDVDEVHGVKWVRNTTKIDVVIAYYLLGQTGIPDRDEDKFSADQVFNSRLVNRHDIINIKTFNLLLSAWYSLDQAAYEASEASIVPTPRSWYLHQFDDHTTYRVFDLHPEAFVARSLPSSSPTKFAQMPFFIKVDSDEQMIETVAAIRKICDEFTSTGYMSAYPNGVPFTYWEQYLFLDRYLVVGIVLIAAAIFILLTGVLFNIWTALLVVVMLGSCLVDLLACMTLLDIKLSAIPAVVLVISLSISAQPLIHIVMAFMTSVGNRERRVIVALRHLASPILHGAISTILSLAILAFSPLDFIHRYFFLVLTILIVIMLVNSLIVLPVLLATFGPNPELIPKNLDAIALYERAGTAAGGSSTAAPAVRVISTALLPTPARLRARPAPSSTGASHTASGPAPGSARPRQRSRGGGSGIAQYRPGRIPSELSLTTISEEPSHLSSSGSIASGVSTGPPGSASGVCYQSAYQLQHQPQQHRQALPSCYHAMPYHRHHQQQPQQSQHLQQQYSSSVNHLPLSAHCLPQLHQPLPHHQQLGLVQHGGSQQQMAYHQRVPEYSDQQRIQQPACDCQACQNNPSMAADGVSSHNNNNNGYQQQRPFMTATFQLHLPPNLQDHESTGAPVCCSGSVHQAGAAPITVPVGGTLPPPSSSPSYEQLTHPHTPPPSADTSDQSAAASATAYFANSPVSPAIVINHNHQYQPTNVNHQYQPTVNNVNPQYLQYHQHQPTNLVNHQHNNNTTANLYHQQQATNHLHNNVVNNLEPSAVKDGESGRQPVLAAAAAVMDQAPPPLGPSNLPRSKFASKSGGELRRKPKKSNTAATSRAAAASNSLLMTTSLTSASRAPLPPFQQPQRKQSQKRRKEKQQQSRGFSSYSSLQNLRTFSANDLDKNHDDDSFSSSSDSDNNQYDYDDDVMSPGHL